MSQVAGDDNHGSDPLREVVNKTPGRTYVFLETAINGKGIGRIVIEVFEAKQNSIFASLCQGTAKYKGKPISYKGSIFHRSVKNLLVQGGDVVDGVGTGGLFGASSNYNDYHDSFLCTFDLDTMWVVAASENPNTDSSQFFITCSSVYKLQTKYPVLGRVVTGRSVVRRIEDNAVDPNDAPLDKIEIINCGLIKKEDPIYVRCPDETGDYFEAYVRDEPLVSAEDPGSAIKAATALKDIGTQLLRQGKLELALIKYKKGRDYLEDYRPENLPDGLSVSDYGALLDLKASLYLNVSLVALKLQHYGDAIVNSTDALCLEGRDATVIAKAHYRRGHAYYLWGDKDQARRDILRALDYAPKDPSILSLLKQINEQPTHFRVRMVEET
uniref:peptidylprolyl isomerase n=1 Tax=Blastobotrys adeninivorans TaxID=409370 RepID=A0A060T972_BLAAD